MMLSGHFSLYMHDISDSKCDIVNNNQVFVMLASCQYMPEQNCLNLDECRAVSCRDITTVILRVGRVTHGSSILPSGLEYSRQLRVWSERT